MTVITFLTAAYQMLLSKAFQPLFKHLPVILTNGDNYKQRQSWVSRFQLIRRLWNGLDDVFDDANEQAAIVDGSCDPEQSHEQTKDDKPVIKQNKYLTAKSPVIWLPHDALGLSRDANEQTKDIGESILISDENAELGEKAVVYARGDPPATE